MFAGEQRLAGGMLIALHIIPDSGYFCFVIFRADDPHEVMMGTRDTDKKEVKKWKHDNSGGQAGTFEAAAQFGEILVLAVAGSAAASAIQQAGALNFTGKIVIDTTNPIAGVSPEHGVLKFFTDLDESLMEKTQRLIPRAKMVKAFNSVGSSQMYKPDLPGGPPTMTWSSVSLHASCTAACWHIWREKISNRL